MSWDSKIDYCGLADTGKLQIKASTMNRSGQYLEKLGADGAIAATKSFGVQDSPSCEYTVLSSFTLTGKKLGAVTEVDGKCYALQSIHYETASGAEPKFSANSVQVEDGATAGGKFDVPGLELSPDEVAAILLSAFTLTGTGCELTKCAADVSCTVGTHKVNGVTVASGSHSAHVQISVTIGQYGDVEPTLTAAEGWDVSSPLTCSDPDSDFPEWTATLSKPIAKATGS